MLAEQLGTPELRVIGAPVGGAFGGKTTSGVSLANEAVYLASRYDVPVKIVCGRQAQFQRLVRYKESTIIDITSGVGSDGLILARKIDTYQDRGHGTEGVAGS